MVEHLLKIVTYTESLEQICMCMKILLKGFNCLDLAIQNIEYLKSFLPRVVYLMRCFYEHTNLLNPDKLQLYDYFQDDPGYSLITSTPSKVTPSNQLHMELIVPSPLVEPYEDLIRNQKHGLQQAQAPE
jgi:hypothetical protein